MLMTPEITPTTPWITPCMPSMTPDTYGSIACTAGNNVPVMNPMIALTTEPTTLMMLWMTGISCWMMTVMPETASEDVPCEITGLSGFLSSLDVWRWGLCASRQGVLPDSGDAAQDALFRRRSAPAVDGDGRLP